jgi:demethylmenaquinone methyltransferase / 2-methoxy-6-polyprenyl-1,4-benzoquinol methylase
VRRSRTGSLATPLPIEIPQLNKERSGPQVPPHPILSDHYAAAEDRVPYIRRLFDESAPSYDRINAWMSLRTGKRYRYDALVRAGLGSGKDVLDLACGTGVVALHAQGLVAPSGVVLALDPSLPMLEEAGRRGVKIRVAGIAEALPLPDRAVDFVSMGYALRHLGDLRVGFAEMLRVLRPGGRLLILEMVPPRSRTGYAMTKLYLKYLVPAITSMVTRNANARRLMEYYWETLDRCVTPEVVLASLREVGFVAVQRSVVYGLFNEYTASRPLPAVVPSALAVACDQTPLHR